MDQNNTEEKYVCWRTLCNYNRIKDIPKNVQILHLFWDYDLDAEEGQIYYEEQKGQVFFRTIY